MVLPQQPTLTLGLVPEAGLLMGLLLVAAIGGGYVSHALRLPRVIGYLLAGVAMRFALPWLLDLAGQPPSYEDLEHAAKPLQAVKDLALGMILFAIGGVFETRHMKAIGRDVLRIGLSGAALTACTVTAGVLLVGWAASAPVGFKELLALAVLLGLAATATAPAATLITLREYQAKGPVSDTVLTITGLSDVVCIVGFQLVFLALVWVGAVHSTTLDGSGLWLGVLLTTVGSVGIGAAMGFVISVVHAKLPVAEALLVVIAALIVLSTGERWLLSHIGFSYNSLLTVLCFGAVFANIAVDPDRMGSAIQTVGMPLFVGFFVLAGYQLHLEDLRHLGWIGVAYVLGRMAGKLIGSWLGVRWVGRGAALDSQIGAGLLCHAAVVIGLADYVGSHWHHPWASRSFVTTILGSAVVFEICGPLLLKRLVVRCGEVKAVTLLRRSDTNPTAAQSVWSLMAEALLRAVRPNRLAKIAKQGPLCVRHIMRTNVKTVPMSATLDEVLRIVEHSRFDHFPVVDDQDHLQGVIHFSDLREFIYDPVLANLVTAADLSNPNTQPVLADLPLDQLMGVFQDRDVGSLPVVNDTESRQVIGVIEQRDLLRAMRGPQQG